MKILHVIASLRSGGAERQLIETLKYLSKQPDISCDILVMSEDIHYDYIYDLDVRLHQLIRNSKKDPSIFLKFYKLVKQIKPDIIHSWNSMCSIYAAPTAKLLGIPFVNNFLQNVPPKLSIKDKEWIRAKLTYPFSDVIAANSYAGLEAYNVPEKKRACLHNGFDFSRLEGLADKDSVKQDLGIQTPKVVGMVASFSENKDYQTFVDAAHLVLDQRKDVSFAAIGDGPYFQDIKERIKPEFQDYFRLPGKQKRVLNIVNTFDIGVLATNTSVHGEGIPNVVMEYMALKKPVIATDCGGNRELIEESKTGFLIEAKNSNQLAEKILQLLQDKDMAIEMGKNGYNKLQAEFSLDVMGKNFYKLYNNIQ